MTAITLCHRRARHAARGVVRRRGFTLIEVLATLMLMAIVLPAIMQGVALATAAKTAARRRTEAAGLAESKLAEIVATGQWENGNLQGNFAPDWADYRWDATVVTWSSGTTNSLGSSLGTSLSRAGSGTATVASTVTLQEIDLRVYWTARGREDSVGLSTLAYVRSSTSSGTSSNTSTTGK